MLESLYWIQHLFLVFYSTFVTRNNVLIILIVLDGIRYDDIHTAITQYVAVCIAGGSLWWRPPVEGTAREFPRLSAVQTGPGGANGMTNTSTSH